MTESDRGVAFGLAGFFALAAPASFTAWSPMLVAIGLSLLCLVLGL